MPVDPQEQAILDQLEAFRRPPLATLQPFNARNLPTVADAVRGVHAKRLAAGDDEGLGPIPEPVARVAHKLIPGPGRDILLRIYTPEGGGPFPVLVYFHGGGFVIANLNVYDASCRALTRNTGCIVVSVAYHQAPERQFPAAIDDAYAAFQWVKGHAAAIGGNPEQVAVVGESAGGNLAAAVSLMARDKGEGAPSYQVLIYPMLNNAFDTPSYKAHGDAKPLNKDMLVWFWGHYLPTERDGANAYACPLKAEQLDGLPPAVVITAEIDPLCSEGEQYAERLRQAGVPVVATRFDGVTHEFFGMGALVAKARAANTLVANEIRKAFGLNADEERSADGTQPPAGHAERAPAAMVVGGTGPAVYEGMEVLSADGAQVGHVKEVTPDTFLVDRKMHRDLYIPFDAIQGIEGDAVELAVAAGDVDHQDWQKPPLF